MATIAGIATDNPDFSILVDVLVYLDSELDADLVATLDDPNADLTVFAPTNAAFGDLASDLGFAGDAADTDAVTAFLVANVPAETILDIVLYHVSPTTQLSGDVAGSATIETLNGATIGTDLPTLVDNEPDLIDPSLVSVDNIADNGVVHVIDKVLLPIDLPGNDAPSITGIVASSGSEFDSNGGDFDILLAAVSAAGLAETLDSAALDATVFAPTDAAFIGLANGLGYAGSDEAGAWSYLVDSLALLNGGDAIPLLTEVLTYHVSGESLQASQVLALDEIATLQGGTIGVNGTTLEDADPDIGDPSIVATDIQASNGVVHVIDGVLLPADLLVSNGEDRVDFVIGSDAADEIRLGKDDDLADGNGGADNIRAGAGDDVVFGGTGSDNIFGGSDRDTLYGDKGNDTIAGGHEGDMLDGGNGDDSLKGDSGADVLLGGNGADMLRGGRGTDILNGGSGDDMLKGGKGTDTFVFESGTGQDRISDFDDGTDLIDLTAFGFAGFGDISAGLSDGVDGAVIDLGGGDLVVLEGVAVAALGADDFLF